MIARIKSTLEESFEDNATATGGIKKEKKRSSSLKSISIRGKVSCEKNILSVVKWLKRLLKGKKEGVIENIEVSIKHTFPSPERGKK